MVRSKEGGLATSPQKVGAILTDHFKSVLAGDDAPAEKGKGQDQPPPPNQQEQEVAERGGREGVQADTREAEAPTLGEVRAALNRLKAFKAPGGDGIATALLQHGGSEFENMLWQLLVQVWEREDIPTDWEEAIIAVLYKGKGDVHDPNNTRGLSLLNTGLKVLSNLVLNRLQPHAEEVIGEYQAGFRRGRSCTDHIHTLRAYLAARREHQQDTHLIFVDFQKAYDTVIREVLWERMREMGIPHKLIRMAQVMSRCTRNRVRTLGRLFHDFITRSGVRQGDALSPLLFNLALESAIRRVLAALSNKVLILAYADDIVILGDCEEAVKEAMQMLILECCSIGLQVNQGKTKYMLSTDAQGPPATGPGGRRSAIRGGN